MKPGRKKGCTNSPSHRAAISAGHAEKRGFTDQEVLDYVEAGHSMRETGEWFGGSYNQISHILIKHGRGTGRGQYVQRERAA